MAYSIRTKYFLEDSNLTNDNNYIKQIYVKNRHWNPPPAPLPIEDKLTEFEKALKAAHLKQAFKTTKRTLSNLTSPQQKILKLLKSDKTLTIELSDKNLGPVIMDTSTYVSMVLKEHLLTPDYLQISQLEAKHRMESLTQTLKNLLKNHQEILSKPEILYFERSLQLPLRLPVFYGLPKVHKTPITLRPVVSSCGSLLSIFSTWLDYKMKDLLPMVKSYLKNSTTVINDLKHIVLPKDALLFSADATSMYTNIDTPTGLKAVEDFIHSNLTQIPTDCPTELFLKTLQLVMDNNIFSFEKSYWVQLSGTAMGTPAACAYATISYGQFENTNILPAFTSNLIYYRRYIDDIIGIWLPPTYNKDRTWTAFTETLNSWGKLKWVIQNPSPNSTFLDLNISIKNSKIITSRFQKDLNLYLYIPPCSAHPPSCLKGLIFGELQRYWNQNPNINDFKEILSKFITRLLDRGHDLTTLTPIFLQSATSIDYRSSSTTMDTDSKVLFIHWPYHPNRLQRKDIRRIYNDTLQPLLSYDHMHIAVSRPLNLKDILTRANLMLPHDINIHTMIENNQNKT
jgi:hypothetical protein